MRIILSTSVYIIINHFSQLKRGRVVWEKRNVKVIDKENYQKVKNMAIWVCNICGWEYDEAEGYPDGGFAAGTKFEDLPADFECPMCGAGKGDFTKQ